MFGWWKRWNDRLRQVDADAASLIAGFGDQAYYVARDRARTERSAGKLWDANRTAGHWDRVRREIGRRTGKDNLDTATRYIEDSRH